MEPYFAPIQLGKGALGTKSMECLTWKCRGTPIGEEKIYLFSYKILSTCFYYVERYWDEVVVGAMIFHSHSNRIMNKKNSKLWDITLWPYFAEINKMEVVVTTFGTL
jgi:hypothetical protein